MRNPLEDPVRDDPLLRVRDLALDLAYGAAYGLWSTEFYLHYGRYHDRESGDLVRAIDQKWGEVLPHPSVLVSSGYLETFDKVRTAGPNVSPIEFNYFRLTPKAFALLETPPPAAIFISYSRRESSAFALLVLARLKNAFGFEPFLDMSISPGEGWEDRLYNEIARCEHFICLIGPNTLESEYVRQEIIWAIERGARTIPIFHNGFSTMVDQAQNDYPELKAFLQRNAIIVEKENAKAYEGAVIELLNYFGFTPS